MKSNWLAFEGGIANYKIEYSIHHSLDLARQPCQEDAAWKEDVCKQSIVNGRIMESFNCTTPWLLHYAR